METNNIKHIVFIICAYPLPPILGGATQTLINYLVEDNEKEYKYNFEVVAPFDEKAFELSKNYKHTKFYYIKESSSWYKLKKYFSAIKRHIFKVTDGNSYFKEANRILRNNGYYDAVLVEATPYNVYALKDVKCNKMIAHLHNDDINIENPNSIKFAKLYDTIFTNSEFTTSRVKSVCPDVDVYTFMNCIDINLFQTAIRKDETYKKYGIPKDKLIVLYVGRIAKQKGVLELIKAFIQSNYLKENGILVIVGSVLFGIGGKTDYSEKVEKLIKDNKDCVFKIGFVTHNELPNLYALGDIGVVPSFFGEETFGLVAVEHMAAHNALIVADSGALSSIVGENGGIVITKDGNIVGKLTKELEELFRNENKRSSLINTENEICKKYSKENYCDRFDELISKIL